MPKDVEPAIFGTLLERALDPGERHRLGAHYTPREYVERLVVPTIIEPLRDEHKASDLTERILVDKMAQALWLTKRALMLQHVTFNHELPTCDDEKQLALYIRYQTTHERNFHKCLNDLLRLRAEKRKQQIGFESQERKRVENDHKQADQTRRAAGESRKQELHKWNVLLAQAKVDNQELQNMRLETPEHRIHGRVERIIAAENAAENAA